MFSYLKCVAYLSLVPILKPFWRRLVKFSETVVSPSCGNTSQQMSLYNFSEFSQTFISVSMTQ